MQTPVVHNISQDHNAILANECTYGIMLFFFFVVFFFFWGGGGSGKILMKRSLRLLPI